MQHQSKFLFFISASMLYVLPCLAQSIGDIDIFDDFDIPQQQSSSAPTSLALPPAQTNNPAGNDPQIGRGKEPLSSLVITPSPLPEVSIDLTTQSQPAQNIPSPVNNRQTAIPLPEKNPTSPPQSTSVFSDFHDVHQFELAGFSLGMTPDEVIQQALRKGYKITKIQKGIPPFQTTYYDALCRQSGLRAPDAVRSCIYQYVKNNDQLYTKEITLENKAARESFQFLFTSPATNNENYQITYQNKGDNSLNFTRVNLAKKLERQKAFLNAVVNSFGNPDDNKKMIWGSEDTAYMQISMTGSSYDAIITMVDRLLSNEDYFANEDWQSEHPSTHHFSFAE